jgi:hypothetical protein
MGWIRATERMPGVMRTRTTARMPAIIRTRATARMIEIMRKQARARMPAKIGPNYNKDVSNNEDTS